MNGFYRIAAATPRLRLGDTEANVTECVRMAESAASDGVAAVVFPELCLTGYTCGDLFFRDDLLSSASMALKRFARKTSCLPVVSVVGLPLAEGAAVYNAAAVAFGGEIAGIVRKRALPNYGEYYERRQFTPAPPDEPIKIFDTGTFRFCIEICEDLWTPVPPSSIAARHGVDIVFNLSASTDYLGKSRRRNDLVCGQSARLGCAYAMASSGTGESSSDAVFGGAPVISVDGRLAVTGELFQDSPHAAAVVVDVGALRYRRRSMSSVGNAFAASNIQVKEIYIQANLPDATPDVVPDSPFLLEYGEPDWHEKVLAIQGTALASRMARAHARKLVVGVSGGADSALALLGAVSAVEKLGLPRTDVVAVVMPGLGSSDRTQKRAAALGEAVGATVRIVDISESCRMHLAGIGHDRDNRDIAYENAQARERMQVLMDIANMENAIVVGTGDLSEIALGWNTYGGDHISMYQLNASIPKTMVLAALRLAAKSSREPVGALLAEIADAPITPELVPGAADNDTEVRLGPYELHDFFLYHYLANGASADKIRSLAEIAFSGKYTNEMVAKTLDTFLRRFRRSQYKRNCVPDGPKITLSLSPRADWRMPSDLP